MVVVADRIREGVVLQRILGEFKKESVEPYCLESCRSHRCCDFSQTGANFLPHELFYVFGWDKQELLLQFKLEQSYGLVFNITDTHFILTKGICPKYDLESRRCLIHNDERSRPLVCKLYPIFLDDEALLVSRNCEFVQTDKFRDFVTEVKANYPFLEVPNV